MRRIAVILMMLVGASVAGCDSFKKAAIDVARVVKEAYPHHPITIVLPPGYQVVLDGKPLQVYGTNSCPGSDPMMNALFGPDPLAGESTCVVLAPEVDVVMVRLLDPKARTLTDEVWEVVRGGETPDAIKLRRPNGSFVGSNEPFERSKSTTVLGMI